ncbi:Nucleotidylyl transferase [Paxillus ammoniavirescens]|nr:Nucleotidylyl transferase [Paxillus ammoniavirescens]
MVRQVSSLLPAGFASHALQALQKVQRGLSPIELVYTSHEHWPLRPGLTVHTRPILQISVLDSSFNPPTLAHLALAKSPPPSCHSVSTHASTSFGSDYDAKLLLLSIRNADKSMKPGDATYIQRLEMMQLLSQDLCSTDSTKTEYGCPSPVSGNIAIAVIDEPTFVGKSTTLLRFLRTRLASPINSSSLSSATERQDGAYSLPHPKLTFLLGFDTLGRLFSPKYYPSEEIMVQMLRVFLFPNEEDCRIVCAHRTSPGAGQTSQNELHGKALEMAQEFIASGRIILIDIGAREQTYSSSEVRAKVAAGDETWKWLVTGVIANYIMENALYVQT